MNLMFSEAKVTFIHPYTGKLKIMADEFNEDVYIYESDGKLGLKYISQLSAVDAKNLGAALTRGAEIAKPSVVK